MLRLEFSPDPKKHVLLQQISVLSAHEYFRLLTETVQSATGKSALVFVHGYNVSFADAARRSAQMTFDLKFLGPPSLFSWPVDKTHDYAVDETNVEWARPDLTQLLIDVLSKTDATAVYLIAHSTGGAGKEGPAAARFPPALKIPNRDPRASTPLLHNPIDHGRRSGDRGFAAQVLHVRRTRRIMGSTVGKGHGRQGH